MPQTRISCICGIGVYLDLESNFNTAQVLGNVNVPLCEHAFCRGGNFGAAPFLADVHLTDMRQLQEHISDSELLRQTCDSDPQANAFGEG